MSRTRDSFSSGLFGVLALPFLSASAGAYFIVQKTWRKVYELELAKSHKAPIPVISVGNIAVGGTGKTPFVMYLVERLVEQGLRPCVVSRGYRGTYSSDYVVVSDGSTMAPHVDATLVGDEPFLMACNLLNKAPVIVGRDRLKCVVFALKTFKSDVAVLDDGFQHLRLKRDVDIVLLSGKEDHMFPLGILREPVSALSRADILVLNSDEEFVSDEIGDFLSSHQHYGYRSSPVSLLGKTAEDPPLDPSHLKGLDVLLVSAIANPERFRKMSQALGWNVVDHLVFRDHHKYAPEDLSNILETANGKNIIFTEKDWVKLPQHFRERDGIFFLKIGVGLERHERFLEQLLDLLKIHGPQS